MIVDQLFTPKLIKEGTVYDLGREYGAPEPGKKPLPRGGNIPRRHPDDPDFMDPDQRRLRADQERVRKAQDEYHAKKGVAEGTAQDSRSWMASIELQYPGVRFVQAKMPGAPIIALVNGKPVAQFDTKKGVNEDQLDEVDWKAWQDKMKAAGKGAKEFTKNVRDTGNAAAGMINAYGGAGKELGKQLIARPTGAVYNATKSGLSKAADVAKSTYGDVKQGVQNVGQAVSTVGTDVGQGLQKVGRGVANVTGGTAGALGSVVGGATTGLGRAGVKGFNTGVQNVGGDAVDRAETNIFKPKSDPAVIKKQIDTKKQEIADLEAQLKTATPVPIGGAQTYDYAGINPATDRPWTKDEIAAFGQPTAPTPTAPVPKPTVAPSVGFTPTNVTYGPGFGGNYYKQKTQPTQAQRDAYQKAIGAPTLPEARIATVLKKPVAEMLQMVETKEDVLRIKQFVDETFVKYGAVNESAFEVRNQILEHVTQVGAQRRREHARKSR